MEDLIAPRPGLKERAIEEVKKAALITLYIWVLLSVFAMYRTIILEQEHINLPAQSFAIVTAVVMAKVILIADAMHVGRRYSEHPLVYAVLWKSLSFSCLLVVFHIIEGTIEALLRGRPLTESLSHMSGGSLRVVLWSGVIIFVALIPFFSFREVSRVVGSGPLWDLFFTRGTKRFTLVVEP